MVDVEDWQYKAVGFDSFALKAGPFTTPDVPFPAKVETKIIFIFEKIKLK